MYIEIHNHKNKNQEWLYFKISNALSIDLEEPLNEKIAGVYAIFKDNICLYVGQSKNIASRIATHLSGKYQNSTQIHIFNVLDIGFSDFYEREIGYQKEILNNSEHYLMRLLKPIDNIDINMDIEIHENEQPLISFDSDYSFVLFNDEYSIKITDSGSSAIEDFEIELNNLVVFKKISNKCYDQIKKVSVINPIRINDIKNTIKDAL